MFAFKESFLTAQESMPLVLFSGLAADGNVFAPQKLAFPQLFVPAWQSLNQTIR